MIISETQSPPPGIWAESWERGLDPWHTDAVPTEFKRLMLTGERRSGWYGLDAYGNVVAFVADGTRWETVPYPAIL